MNSDADDGFVSRAELSELAQKEGLNISVRTLRYWAQKGFIPRPTRKPGYGNRAFYHKSLLERLRILAALRPANIQALRRDASAAEIMKFGESQFEIAAGGTSWQEAGREFSMHRLANGQGILLICRKGSNRIGGIVR